MSCAYEMRNALGVTHRRISCAHRKIKSQVKSQINGNVKTKVKGNHIQSGRTFHGNAVPARAGQGTRA